jgi:formiminotetrahydrofolate cyclodeaminase
VTFKELTVGEFIQAVSEGTPTPGGGSVSALTASLSSALVSMVGSLTAIRLQAKIAQESNAKASDTCCKNVDSNLLMLDTVSTANELQVRLLALTDEDSEAYNKVIAAYRLPKSTEEEKRARSSAIQDALETACLVPAQVVKCALEVLRLSEILVDHGMKSALSDVAVACLTAWAGMRGAYFNVRINLPSIKDEAFVKRVADDVATCMSSGKAVFERVMALVEEAL